MRRGSMKSCVLCKAPMHKKHSVFCYSEDDKKKMEKLIKIFDNKTLIAKHLNVSIGAVDKYFAVNGLYFIKLCRICGEPF